MKSKKALSLASLSPKLKLRKALCKRHEKADEY